MDIYLVGGAVRDQLLGYPYHEKDWVVVGATADELIALGYQPVGKDFPVFLHPETREEYALARTERKTGPGYTGFDCYASPDVTLEEDLQRRDLTINAMAQTFAGEIIDPYGGQRDIKARVLRHVSPAFVEDPLRVLRVARFAARFAHLGFTIATETLQIMQSIAASNELQALPGERIWKETERALTEASPQAFFTVLQHCDALPVLMPELSTLNEATLKVLQQAAQQQQPATICFALLCHRLNDTAVNSLCDKIKAPNEFRHLAVLVAQQSHQLQQDSADAAHYLALLTATDAFRKPDRLQRFLTCGRYLYPHSNAPQQLQQALAACERIDVQNIIAEGFKGKAIGDELARRRQQAIAQQLSAKHS